MSDDAKSPESFPAWGWMKLFHASGALVTLPVPCDPRSIDCYKTAFSAVSEAVAAGFTVSAPGLTPGEQKEEIGYVLRRSKTNEDRSETPIIDLYLTNEAVKFKVLTVYLNDDAQIEAFERASGMSLATLKEFPGTAAPERGSNRQSDSFIVRVPKPFGVVMIPNPKYDEKQAAEVASRGKGEIYGVPKRKFVRWDGIIPAKGANGEVGGKVNTASTEAVDKPTLDKFTKVLAAGPDVETLNGLLPQMNGLDKYTWRAIWNAIKGYADREGMDWNEGNKRFVAPVEAPSDNEPVPF